MSRYPTVYILTAVHNKITFTKKLLYCIYKQTFNNIKVVIVDDGSTDGTYKFLTTSFPDITVIKGNGSLWWTGSLYQGVENILTKAVEGDFILTLNTDCTFDPQYVSTLIRTGMEYPRSIIGSLVVDIRDKETIIDGGINIDWSQGKLFTAVNQNKNRKTINEEIISDGIETLSTKGTLYPVEVFKKVGNFDKKHLPHYVSDYEFACRAKHEGYNLLKSYKAILYNYPKNTGFGDEIKGKLKISELLLILFSRKSKRNIFDLFWFITLCCPGKYKVKNYLSMIYGLINLFSVTWPINIIADPIIAIRKK